MTGSQAFLEPPAQVLEVLLRLSRAGHEAFVVGGAVRDLVLGRVPQDWDVATSASPSQISSLFPRVILTGARHGTVTVRLTSQNIEVSSFRGKSIWEDLSHRDFTLDAMAYDLQAGSILDPHGGRADAQAGLLKAVGQASERMAEDPLRALRGIRLAAELGLRLDPELMAAIRAAAASLKKVALERIRQELERILLVRDPSGALKLLVESSLMKEILPELESGGKPSSLYWLLNTADLVPARVPLRWSALMLGLDRDFSPLTAEGPQEALASKAREVLWRLRVSRRQTEQTARILYHHALSPRGPWDEGRLRRLIFQAGILCVEDAILLRKASLEAVGAPSQVVCSLGELLEKLRLILSEPEALGKMRPVLDGREVMRLLGLEPGPRVGEILAQMQEAVLLEPELNQEEALKRWLLEKLQTPAQARST